MSNATPDPAIAAAFGGPTPLLSVEFFPPKDEAGGVQILETALAVKAQLKPDFVSITYGAGGTTRERTFRYARILREEHGFLVMPHLTCVGSSRDELEGIVRDYHDAGFRNIMALRGDPPKGDTQFRPHPDGLAYANELVTFVQQRFSEICLGVAGYPEVHPEAESLEADLAHLRRKVEAGAAFVTTQLFYDTGVFLDFLERARAAGITVPILPGLMPIRSAAQSRRFCKYLPEALGARLDAAGKDTAAVEAIGVDWCFRQIEALLDAGVPGIHLYILNRSAQALALMERLRESGVWQHRALT